MPAFYFDSSALVKCYVDETGSAWVRQILAPAAGNDLHVIQIAKIEITSAIVRRRKAKAISAPDALIAITEVEKDFAGGFIVLDSIDRFLDSALSLVKIHELRALDGIQLAAAVELNRVRAIGGLPAMTIVSADLELNGAAQREGLGVDNPNDHP